MMKYIIIFTALLWQINQTCLAHSVENQIQLIKKVKQSVVGVGVYNPLSAPRYRLRGTGFVVQSQNGKSLIATNHHVVNDEVFEADKAQISVHVSEGKSTKFYVAKLISQNARTDVAILEVNVKLPILELEKPQNITADGSEILLTGMPIGSVLGFYKASHKGMVAAYVPMAIPQKNASQLSIEVLKRLRDPLFVYQLDVTAYPGNSGSAVIDLHSGKVIAILNSVLVKKTKEHVLSDPSGISYAIPSKYISELLKP